MKRKLKDIVADLRISSITSDQLLIHLPKQFITIGGSEGQTYVLIPDGGPDARRLAEVIVDSLRYRLHLPDLPAVELRP